MKRSTASKHHQRTPLVTLTAKDEQRYLAQRFGGRGEVEVIGLLGLSALIFSLHLLYLLS